MVREVNRAIDRIDGDIVVGQLVTLAVTFFADDGECVVCLVLLDLVDKEVFDFEIETSD